MECVLGVDIGTTNVKVTLFHRTERRIIVEHSAALGQLEVKGDVVGGNERSVSQVLRALEHCMQQIESSLLGCVCAVGVCGQMHGCVLWSSDLSQPPSNLITWQDGRCDTTFLSSLPPPRRSIPVSTGYGCATLAWLQRHRPDELAGYDRAGTIMDYVVWRLIGSKGPVSMSSQNAQSWGYFDQLSVSWELDTLSDCRFPVHLLPKVVTAPVKAGTVITSWLGLPVGVPVGVAMGDLQCSILATELTLSDIALNIGTSSQLAVVVNATPPDLPPTVSSLPYFSGQSLLVAASLTGGNIISTMVTTLNSWMTDLGVTPPTEREVYTRMIAKAQEKQETSLQVDVQLWGERHAPFQTGSVGSITPYNVSLGDVGNAVFRGIVQNLLSMFTPSLLQQLQVKAVLGSGSALIRNSALQRHAEEVLGVPLVIKKGVDAPLGAAMAVDGLCV